MREIQGGGRRELLLIASIACLPELILRNEMWSHDADEFAGRDHLGLLPELRKMPLIAGHEIVGAGSIGALQKLVVAGVLRDLERMRRPDQLRMVPYELEELLAEPLANFKFRAGEHFAVFRENGFGDVQPGRFGNREHEDRSLKSIRFKCRRDEYVGINNKPERDHPRLGFGARVALMT